VRVRIKSSGMTVLGMEEQGAGRASGKTKAESNKQETPELPSIGGVLKGLFGR
jgi:hypothetical protein